jgi:hypothetical protein
MNIIIIYKFTKLANAPDELYKLLNNHNINNKYKIIFIHNDKNKLINIIQNLDKNDRLLIHFNNKILNINKILNNNNYNKNNNIKFLLHYHSEPLDNRTDLIIPKYYYTAVLNQYHCLLKEYSNCNFIVRNCFNNNKDIIFNNKIKIGFYPSQINRINKYYDKGYPQTKNIFDKLSKIYKNVIFDIKYNISYDECIRCKRDCHIIIDECITGSFHKTTLEGISLGNIVIVYIQDELNKKHKELYNNILPIENSNINHLENKLIELIELGKDKLEEKAFCNLEMFKNYWNDEIVANEYFNMYNKILN